MRVFIVEDDKIHIEAIKIAVTEAGYEIAGECDNADDAFNLIKESNPDILLVDIALPGFNNGISLADKVYKALGIPHIYTTSYTQDEVIAQAISTHPAGYLRKPVDMASLKATIQLALQKNDKIKNDNREFVSDSFFVKIGDRLIKVIPDDILMIKADGENCVSIILNNKEIICRTTLKEIYLQLPSNFIQVHRSYLINVNQLDAFNEREQTAILKNHSAPVARNFKKELLNLLRKI
jgi:DNA-binding LytR/AlgR family response regulator